MLTLILTITKTKPRIPSLPLTYGAISPSPLTHKAIRNCLTIKYVYTRYAPTPPYLNIDDGFRMFGRCSAPIKSSDHQIRQSSRITTARDDPFGRQFVSPSNQDPHRWSPTKSKCLPMVFDIAKQEQGSTSTWEMRIGNSHKLSLDSTGAMFSSLLNMPSCRAPIFLLLAFCCAKTTFLLETSKIFDFILNLVSYPTTSAHSYNIRTAIVAHHGL